MSATEDQIRDRVLQRRNRTTPPPGPIPEPVFNPAQRAWPQLTGAAAIDRNQILAAAVQWREVDISEWRWPHFTPEELACRGTGLFYMDERVLDFAESLRAAMGSPLIVNSAYRSPSHNRAVGGATSSQHMLGRALDVSVANHDPHVMIEEARRLGAVGVGTYPTHRTPFIHFDLRSPDGTNPRWGASFPPRTTRFDPNSDGRRDRLNQTGDTGAGAAVTGVAGTAGAAAAANAEGLGFGPAEVISGVAVAGIVAVAIFAVWAAYKHRSQLIETATLSIASLYRLLGWTSERQQQEQETRETQ